MTTLRSLTVLNNSLVEVDLLYVCNDGAAAAEEEEERSFVRIPPGEHRTQETFAEHKWRCRSRPDGTLLVTVACGDANLFVTDLSPELGEPRRLALDNHTQAEAEALWLDGESGAESSYLRAPPGESRTQQTFEGHTWRLKSAADASQLATVVLGAASPRLGLGGLPPTTSVLTASGAPSAEGESATERGHSGPSTFYAQRVTIGATGLAIRAHAAVSPHALAAAAEVVGRMLQGCPREVVARLAAAGCTVAVIGREQVTSDVPEHAFLSGERCGSRATNRHPEARRPTPDARSLSLKPSLKPSLSPDPSPNLRPDPR